jgi:thiamine kinase-like enzyme
MGFQSDFRGVLCLEDLGNCESFSVGTHLPEKYASYLSAKLAQLHALNWHKPIHPEIPSEYTTPEAYLEFFKLKRNFMSKNLNQELTIKQLDVWKDDCAFLQEPVIREALISFSEHNESLFKYETNSKLQSSPLFQHLTFLHGDFHSGNVLFITEPSEEDPETKNIKDSILIDWQCYGYGHPSTEFSYFIGNVDYDPDQDLQLMKIYYDELTKTINPEVYPWEVFQREVEIRNVQFVMAGFNMIYSNTPEDFKRWKSVFEKRGVDFDHFFNSYRPKYLRMAHILGKWAQENILERIEEF